MDVPRLVDRANGRRPEPPPLLRERRAAARALEVRRVCLALDWMIRTHTTIWLHAGGLHTAADAIDATPEIVDLGSALAVDPQILTADQAASAAARDRPHRPLESREAHDLRLGAGKSDWATVQALAMPIPRHVLSVGPWPSEQSSTFLIPRTMSYAGYCGPRAAVQTLTRRAWDVTRTVGRSMDAGEVQNIVHAVRASVDQLLMDVGDGR